MKPPNLDEAAQDFAEQLSGTIGAVVGFEVAFTATRLLEGDRLTVSTTDRMGIVLTAGREPLLRLAVEFQCGWDAPGHFLAVHKSQVHVSSVEDRAPLLRYEFVKSPQSGIPCSHLHVHAHRDAFTHAMSRAGERTPRAKRRARGRAVGRVEDLHFPLGGARFRPALEDVLQMLVDEFGIDAADQWESHLAQGRQDWRHHQLAAAIRDNQKHAADTLAGLGYTVEPPLEGFPEGPGRQVSSY